MIAVCWFILRRTTLGVTHIYGGGGKCRRRDLTGIKVWLVLLFVYGMSGLLSGLAAS